MKYAFIQRNKLVWPISVQCRVLLVSVSGYHEHLARRVGTAQRRHLICSLPKTGSRKVGGWEGGSGESPDRRPDCTPTMP
jgi:hypothetical protein